jgi:hypothetical protein
MAPAPRDTHSSWVNTAASRATLSAIYTDISTSTPSRHQFSHPISAPIPDKESTSISDKKNYLSELRDSVKMLQDQINVFLTEKMEEDKVHAGTNRDGVPVKKAGEKTADELEEENYGEESVEDVEQG